MIWDVEKIGFWKRVDRSFGNCARRDCEERRVGVRGMGGRGSVEGDEDGREKDSRKGDEDGDRYPQDWKWMRIGPGILTDCV
jgi:hypothetical protein